MLLSAIAFNLKKYLKAAPNQNFLQAQALRKPSIGAFLSFFPLLGSPTELVINNADE
jgi:hypothetical protein